LALTLILLELSQEIYNFIAIALLLLLVVSFLLKTEPYISKKKEIKASKTGKVATGKKSEKASAKKAEVPEKLKSPKQVTAPMKKEKVKANPKPQKDKPEKGFLHYLFFGRGKENRIRDSLRSSISLNDRMISQSKLFEDIVKNTNWNFETSNAEQKLIDFPGCSLIETRKGARVTERNSTSSGRGYAGVRVGPVFLGGSGSSSSYSQSVSYPAPDVLQTIDVGTFIVSTRKVSFAGGMFAKNTEFKKIVDYTTDGSSILIVPSTGTKVWICRFPEVADQWIASALIEVAGESSDRKLSKTSKYMEVMNVSEAFKSSINYRRAEIKLALEEIAEERLQKENQLKNLRAIYGPRIRD